MLRRRGRTIFKSKCSFFSFFYSLAYLDLLSRYRVSANQKHVPDQCDMFFEQVRVTAIYPLNSANCRNSVLRELATLQNTVVHFQLALNVLPLRFTPC